MSEYTAEQLKAWAEDCEGVGFCESAEQYRSHATERDIDIPLDYCFVQVGVVAKAPE